MLPFYIKLCQIVPQHLQKCSYLDYLDLIHLLFLNVTYRILIEKCFYKYFICISTSIRMGPKL